MAVSLAGRKRNEAELCSALKRKRHETARRAFLHLASGAAALPAMSRIAGAQSYPTRLVRIVVGFLLAARPTLPHV